MKLLLDIGNSRLKWAVATGGELLRHGALMRDARLFEALTAAWGALPRPEGIVASNVAGEAFGAQLDAWVRGRWGVEINFVQVQQGWSRLRIAYPQPQFFGVDRWLALIAARHLYSGALCVADCGTAVTVDAVDGEGAHLGGVIVPGLALMQQALLQRSGGVSNGFAADRGDERSPLGGDTRSGIERGALYAIAGAIEQTLARVKSQVESPITTIITGGDAEAILAAANGQYHHEPHLVMHGLRLLAE